MNRFFADGEEFSLIEKMFGADRFSRDGRGLGDDGFLLESPLKSPWVVTADASAEGVHYRLDWVSPERALRKALLSNLSDINAMGGRSRHAFLNLGARPEWDESVFAGFGRTLRGMEEEFGFRVSGGDTVRTSGAGFFAFTVLGEMVGSPLLRSACVPGHRIYVSGSLGASAAGLRLLQQGTDPRTSKQPEHALIAVHFDPRPPLELGPLLASFGKSIAAIDVSDGLSSDLGHLARQSGCALRVAWEKLPAHPALLSMEAQILRTCVLDGGEDYALLFTGDFSEAELARLRAVASIAEIGEVEKGEGVFLTESGKASELSPGGFSH